MHKMWSLSPYSVFGINEYYPLDAEEYISIVIVEIGRAMFVFYNLQTNLTVNKNIVLE